MKSQATRVTQKQLAYLAYWQQRGYTFDRDAVLPEDIEILPEAWRLPRVVDLAFTAVCLTVIAFTLYLEGGFL